MAFAPVLVAAAPYIIGGATLAVGAYSAYQTKKVGLIQRAELKAQAKTEAAAAGQQQIERRRSLIRALSSQNAAAGAAGIQTSGSVEAIARRDIRDARNDLLVGDMNSQARQRSLRSQGANSVRVANANATSSLIDSANTAYRAMG